MGAQARRAALRDRRRRHQGQLPGHSARIGLHRESPALGDCVQVSSPARDHRGERYSRTSRPHRHADARSRPRAGAGRRRHCQPFHPAQHGRNRPPGIADRRHRADRARRRSDPSRAKGDQGRREPQTVSHAEKLPGVRQRHSPCRRRSRLPLRQRRLPRKTQRIAAALRQPPRHGHQRPRRQNRRPASGQSHGQRHRGPVHAEAGERSGTRPHGRKVRAKSPGPNRSQQEAHASAANLRARHSHGRRAHRPTPCRAFLLLG